uniref:Pentatricopeptide repeat-containing protein n=1 Tax=Kalanchoe fedtschenkoi TaxID=63787 RepID=A0A7N0TA22_KALFE
MCLRRFSTWSSAIRNTASSTSPSNAVHLFTQMLRQPLPADSFSLLYTLKSSAGIKHYGLISSLHSHVTKTGFCSHLYVATALLNAYAVTRLGAARQLFDEMPERNTVTWNVMISGYARAGDLVQARLVFDRMPEKGVASWAALISGCINHGQLEQGLGLCRQMMMVGNGGVRGGGGIIPDHFVLVSVLAGCSRIGSVGLLAGKSVHAFVTKSGLKLGVELGSAMVDMYAKCGVVDSATKVAGRMTEWNVTTWTLLICGLAQNGHGQEAVSLFKMIDQKQEQEKEDGTGSVPIRPNEMTFTAVLSACAQAGLVQEGQKYFNLLKNSAMEVKIQHYGCMVDLYGKAGRLDDAYQIINEMELPPNNVVWGSFLAACKVHKQLETAERVIEQVLATVKPEEDGGVYSLICDLYTMLEKWDDAERIRSLMVNRKVKKARGSSFIFGPLPALCLRSEGL